MTQLLQEERDFYKRECELLRNMKEKSVLMSPPTRERVLCSPTLFSPLFDWVEKPEPKKFHQRNIRKTSQQA